MSDMSAVIVPKSDQLNADDLIAGPITIKITGVAIKGGTEQPIAISFEGDNGKPYKACKSMCRIMVAAWGPDSKRYSGRSMTLYRDPAVKWAGMEVGGIRISHMSDIEAPLTMALTQTRANRKPFTVKPLKNPAARSAEAAVTPLSVGPATDAAGPIITRTQTLEGLCKKAAVSLAGYLKRANVQSAEELSDDDYAELKAVLERKVKEL